MVNNKNKMQHSSQPFTQFLKHFITSERSSSLLLALTVVNAPLYAEVQKVCQTVDKVLAIIYHEEGSKLILQSDLRPDLSDNTPTLKDVIVKELILLDAKRLKIPVTDAEVDRHLARVQEQLKMTRAELTEFFKERGYTFEEGRKELEKNLLLEITIEQRVKSKAHVPQSELEKYHKEHPEVIYEIKQAFVPFDDGLKATKRDAVERALASGTILTVLEWVGPTTMQESDIAQDKSFIKELKPGATVKVGETDAGISLVHLVSKKVTPFEERKQKIASLLGRERYMKAMEQYYDGLLNEKRESRVRYIHSQP